MENTFFKLSKARQVLFQLKLFLVFIAFNTVLCISFIYLGISLQLVFTFTLFTFALSLTVIAPFFDIPSAVKSGNLHYYSAMLIAEKVKNNQLILHSGSLFDYYFSLDSQLTTGQRKKAIFASYINGLIALINKYENQPAPDLSISVTSYFLNARTAYKLGLTHSKTNSVQRVIVYFNYLNLTCSLSLLNSRLTLPKINKTMTFTGELSELMRNKSRLIALQERLEN